MAALAVDRATLSKMLSVAALPSQVLQAIGPAKSIGWDRWYDLKLLLEKPSSFDAAHRAISDEKFVALSSDERFDSLALALKTAAQSPRGQMAHESKTGRQKTDR